MGIMDGIYLAYRMTIATELAESSELSNQASGYVHAAMAPMAMSKKNTHAMKALFPISNLIISLI